MTENNVFQQVQEKQVDQDLAGQRIDNYLITLLKGVPKSRIYRIIRKGEVRVNKKRVDASYKLQSGDIIRVPPIRLEEREDPLVSNLPRADSKLRQLIESAIIFEDNTLLVLNKPSGMAVHGGSGVSWGVIELLRHLYPDHPYWELVHRLDRDTSGCLLVAKRRSRLRSLHAFFRERAGFKCYFAIVKGQFKSRKTVIVNQPLHRDTLPNGERIVYINPEGKSAHSEFNLIEQFKDCALVRVVIKTGRTHQIRVHAAYLGHPILNDDKYGDRDFNKSMSQRTGVKRLCLHARELEVLNQEGDGTTVYTAELDQEWQSLIHIMQS